MKEEIAKLVEDIKTAAQDYYDGNQHMTDAEFDSMVDKLREIDPENEVLHKVGWGYDISKVSQIKANHLTNFTGLTKIKVDNSFLFRYTDPLVITAKLDGGSVELQYKDGVLMRALTRGDGYVGIDCTEKLIHSQGVPTKLPEKYTGNVVGEYVLANENAEKYSGDIISSRNTSNGFLGRKSVTPEECSIFSFVAYRISYSVSHEFRTHRDILRILSNYGFIVPHELMSENPTNFLDAINNLANICGKTYLLDGIVVNKNNLIKDDNRIIYPGSRAYKTIIETADVMVDCINWNFTRTGKLVPVIHYEAIKLSGATLENASGYNADFILRNKIKPGVLIRITRGNEVIPVVLGVIIDGKFREAL